MKKFLAILLIAIVACEAVEDVDLFGGVIDWLKNAGIYDAVKNYIISASKSFAISFCSRYLPGSICSAAVEAIASSLGY